MPSGTPRVDAVIVAYNSARTLRACVEPLSRMDSVRVCVVDNASPDDSLGTLDGLDVKKIRAVGNDGFAAGCNLGIAATEAPYVLLLNPDARLRAEDVAALADALDTAPGTAIVGPRILEDDGELAYSLRRFPRRRSTYAQALFLHRLWPRAPWTDELIRDPGAYEKPGSFDWVSGACMLIRRTALEEVGGLDEQFFLYCEDMDLCARVREAGWDVHYDPGATARHEGGASAPREQLLAIYARNRVIYARKHDRRGTATVEAAGVALGHLTHAITAARRPGGTRGHLRALVAAVRAPTGGSGRPKGV